MESSTTGQRRTKLVCTIGPASIDRVRELVDAGMNVARVNFSHGTPDDHERAARAVRDAATSAGRSVALLVDLAGPKIRLGELAGGSATLRAGTRFTLRASEDGGAGARPGVAGDTAKATVTYANLPGDVRPGDRILLADGAAELRVDRVDEGGAVVTEVVRGGLIRSRAGLSIPAERLSTPALTAQDREDLPRAMGLGADYVAQSFVRRAADIEELRDALGSGGPPIVAKIETRPAIDDFDAILAVVDGVMVARGDLGVELPYEEVPIIQKQLVRRALDAGVPSIVATQMLESMLTSPRPTRAEASDVANAVFDGADAIMLSGETAIGQYPVLAAEAASRICGLCEERGKAYLPAGAPLDVESDAAALAYAAVALTNAQPDIAGIACYTRTGRTARMLAALRPRVPIHAFSPDPAVVRRLAPVHGVVGGTGVPPDDATGRLGLMAWLLAEQGSVPAGAPFVLVASTAEPGTGPNVLEVHRVPAMPS